MKHVRTLSLQQVPATTDWYHHCYCTVVRPVSAHFDCALMGMTIGHGNDHGNGWHADPQQMLSARVGVSHQERHCLPNSACMCPASLLLCAFVHVALLLQLFHYVVQNALLVLITVTIIATLYLLTSVTQRLQYIGS